MSREQDRLANVEVALQAVLLHLIDGRIDLDRVARELFECNSALGGFKRATIDAAAMSEGREDVAD